MDTTTNERAEARSRATRRLHRMTIGTALLAVAATGGLTGLAATGGDGTNAGDHGRGAAATDTATTTAADTATTAASDTGHGGDHLDLGVQRRDHRDRRHRRPPT